MQVCKICNKDFISKRITQKFCNPQCNNIDKNNKRRMALKKYCKICQTEFISKTRNHAYCSKQCNKINKNNKRRQVPQDRLCVCIVCNKKFEGTIRKQKYCSKKCAKKTHKIPLNKTCKICGKDFLIDSTIIKYCNKQCAEIAKKEYGNKTYYHAMRRARKRLATPPWLTDAMKTEMEIIYIIAKTCSHSTVTNTKYHVDHIVPLAGKTVSGLHVPWNLQILTAKENLKKSNKLRSTIHEYRL